MGRSGLKPGMPFGHGFTVRCDTNSAHRPMKKRKTAFRASNTEDGCMRLYALFRKPGLYSPHIPIPVLFPAQRNDPCKRYSDSLSSYEDRKLRIMVFGLLSFVSCIVTWLVVGLILPVIERPINLRTIYLPSIVY